MLVKLDKKFKVSTLCKLIHHDGDEGVTGSCHEFFPSAHADEKNLTNFIKRMRIKPKVVKLIHGDASAKRALSKSILEACS